MLLQFLVGALVSAVSMAAILFEVLRKTLEHLGSTEARRDGMS
jgi:hypothetical protein